jgi:hypothetical protein
VRRRISKFIEIKICTAQGEALNPHDPPAGSNLAQAALPGLRGARRNAPSRTPQIIEQFLLIQTALNIKFF